MMQEGGEQIGRFKVRGLMRKLELISKQPRSHACKQATVERPDIPNILNREFDVRAARPPISLAIISTTEFFIFPARPHALLDAQNNRARLTYRHTAYRPPHARAQMRQ